MDIKTIGIVGAGQMGSGIAEVSLQAGFKVLMSDISQEAVKRGTDRIKGDFERRTRKGKLAPGEGNDLLAKLITTVSLEDLKDCDIIIEAATENVALKKEIFNSLDRITRRDAILASNTSSISITRIAGFTDRPDRVIGMHFFNPVPVMKLIELVRGLNTSDTFIQRGNSLVHKTENQTTRYKTWKILCLMRDFP